MLKINIYKKLKIIRINCLKIRLFQIRLLVKERFTKSKICSRFERRTGHAGTEKGPVFYRQ